MIPPSESKTFSHSHSFGQDRKRPGESRTRIVLVLTAVTMAVEIVAGTVFGSMALLADGLHMASHAVAIGIASFAYVYARQHAHDVRFSFGTGKVNALAGFAGALMLAVFAAGMVWESVARWLNPVDIAFAQAIAVAGMGLLVNVVSALVLGGAADGRSHHHGDHHHQDPYDEHASHGDESDHSLRSAYFHVLADALTSVLAIVALLAAHFLGWGWIDPLMGIVGALLVGRWSLGLLRTTSGILLDHQAAQELRDRVLTLLAADANVVVSDLHLWAIGPDIFALAMTVVTDRPSAVAIYKQRLAAEHRIVHVTIEVLSPEGTAADFGVPQQTGSV